MGIAEMKLEAIIEISKLEDAGVLKEILNYLSHLSQPVGDKTLYLARHYGKAKDQYGDLLTKLAQ